MKLILSEYFMELIKCNELFKEDIKILEIRRLALFYHV